MPLATFPPIGDGAALCGAPQAASAEASDPIVEDSFGVPMSWTIGAVVDEFDADAKGTWFRLPPAEPAGEGCSGRQGGLESGTGKLVKGKPKGLSPCVESALPSDLPEFRPTKIGGRGPPAELLSRPGVGSPSPVRVMRRMLKGA